MNFLDVCQFPLYQEDTCKPKIKCYFREHEVCENRWRRGHFLHRLGHDSAEDAIIAFEEKLLELERHSFNTDFVSLVDGKYAVIQRECDALIYRGICDKKIGRLSIGLNLLRCGILTALKGRKV